MTRHFSIAELADSDIAERKGIDNTPPEAVIPNLERLMRMLEQVREVVGGRPVVITSGYRSARLNKEVGGSKTSAHVDGRAADIKVVGLTPFEAALMIRNARLPLDQLIYEGKWVHIGIARESEKPRMEVMTARFVSGEPEYYHGILS